jgi:hypothetical protein
MAADLTPSLTADDNAWLVFGYFQKYFVAGLTQGAVKG